MSHETRPRFVNVRILSLLAFAPFPVWACATCGQDGGFTPQMLLMTMTFAFLPLSLMLALGWRIFREDEEGSEYRKKLPYPFGKKESGNKK